MALVYGTEPRFVNDTERLIWDRLLEQLADDCIVLPNVTLTDEDQDHEADFLVLVPDGGVVTLEVIGRNELSRLGQRVRQIADQFERNFAAPTDADLRLVAEILFGWFPMAASVVEEARDFAERWWTPLLAALHDPDEGGLYVHTDENQALFPRFERIPVALTPLLLDHNLRNTKQIARSFASLAPMRMEARGGDGPEVEFIHVEGADDILAAADEQVERLRDEGWESQDIALITTGSRHPVQKELQDDLGPEGYWRTFWDDEDVFYGHVLGCKGLERRAVVLAVNESIRRDRAKERLYVGLSRATDRLVVVGDAAYVKEVGGPELARGLGLQ